MQEKINELLKQIGRPYQMFNDDGTYQGCFYPVQFLFPDKPKYNLRSNDDDKNYWYGFAKIKEHCLEIDINDNDFLNELQEHAILLHYLIESLTYQYWEDKENEKD